MDLVELYFSFSLNNVYCLVVQNPDLYAVIVYFLLLHRILAS